MKTHAKLSENFFEFPTAFNLRGVPLTWKRFILTITDLFSITISSILGYGLYQLINVEWEGPSYLILEPLLVIMGSTYVLVGQYRTRNVSQVEELRLLTITTTILFLTLFALNLWVVDSKYPAAIFGFSWVFSIAAVPLARYAVRWVGSAIGIWGEPVVIIGNGKLSRKILRFLLKNTYCGMKPVLIVDGLADDAVDSAEKDPPIPVVPYGLWPPPLRFRSQMGVSTAIVVAPDLPPSISEAIARGEHLGFSNIITVTKQFNTRNFGLTPVDFGGILGFEERHYELDIFEDRLIRVVDLFLIFVSLPILVPCFLGIMLAIRLDSGGSIFYRQTRIGKGAREFKVLKFRTMVENADKVLTKYLNDNPKLLAEWNADHKLRDDPRITRIGKFLRKTSLDELPQLWNVLKGEMGLIGPRPIVAEEIVRYGNQFHYYAQVPPGISGLWQVSGRNDIDYEQRVSLDEYYVRNRSIWMNLYILIRTIMVVVRRNGAY